LDAAPLLLRRRRPSIRPDRQRSRLRRTPPQSSEVRSALRTKSDGDRRHQGAAIAIRSDYLENVAPEAGFVCDAPAIADIAIAVHFANFRWSRTGVDLAAWPRTTAWIDRVEQTAALARPSTLAERRPLHGEMGIELTETSFAGQGFRNGPTSV
jgi:glutathione S-transferase